MKSAKNELDAVIIFHDEWEDVARLCVEFRKYHPKGIVHLAIDGNNYPSKIPCSRATLLPRIDPMQALHDQLNRKEPTSDGDPSSFSSENLRIMWHQIQRLDEIRRASTSDFIVFLEYDSKIRGRVRSCAPFDVATVMPNKYEQIFISMLKEMSDSEEEPPEGWGFVTDVLRTESLRKAVDWAKQDGVEKLRSLVYEYPGMAVMDFLVPVLFYLSGQSVGKSTQTTECNRSTFWMFGSTPLVHQFRGRHKHFSVISNVVEKLRNG